MHKPSDSNTKTKTVIEASHLSAGYKGTYVWKNANFTVKQGEFVAILGPNGAGKTTLFRLLLGLYQPQKGDLRLFGTKPKRGNNLIGYVPQRRPLDGDMNIEAAELVRLGSYGNTFGLIGSRRLRQTEEKVRNALRLVNAENLAHKPIGQLSGGESQRIFLAQSLVSNPKLLMLDEPFANLDIRREGQLAGLVNTIVREEGVSVLLITHDLNPLLPFLDKVIYMANGNVTSGTPEEVITSEALSALYDSPIEVLHDSKGRVAVLGVEEAIHHD